MLERKRKSRSCDIGAVQMLRDYNDIYSRISDPILWWDDNGVPRYCEFHPSKCGVYEVVVALVEVLCHSCRAHFRVTVSFDRYSLHDLGDRYAPPTTGGIGSFHFGDPPAHGDGCLGNTMQAHSIRVLEFWQHDDRDWTRHPCPFGKTV
jgi:hypothetical protein